MVSEDRQEHLPPMAHHTAKEFLFASKTLRKMVLDSNIFPARADRDDWFKPHDDTAHAADGSGGSSHGKRTSVGVDPELSQSESAHATVSVAKQSICPIRVSGTEEHKSFPDDDGVKCSGVPRSTSSCEDTIVRTSKISLSTISPSADSVEAPFHNSVSVKANTQVRPKVAAAKYSPVPSVLEREIDYGPILGKGGFCEVRLAILKKDKGQNKPARLYAMKYLSPTKPEPKEAAGVHPKPRNKQFERGIADLAIEARFLALLSHGNIIRMHYISGGSLDEQFNCKGGCDFNHQFGLIMLIDPLFETLATRIDETYIPQVFLRHEGSNKGSGATQKWWKRMVSNNTPTSMLPWDSWKINLAQRLEGLKGIAEALQYLHDDCSVIYRDCKPDNIGFYRKPHPKCHCGKRSPSASANSSSCQCTCYTEIPKLFDFGLAKELKPKLIMAHPHHERDHAVDTYKLTARSGSRRYMAPEVAFATPYNEKADVYSFGIMLYQVASLVTPFEGFTLYRHEKEVLCGGNRPNVKISSNRRVLGKIKKGFSMSYGEWMGQHNHEKRDKYLEACTKCVWIQELSCLIEECWHDDMRLRPSMKDVVQRLEGCIQELAPEGLRKSLMQETVSSGASGGVFESKIGGGQ